MDTCRNLPWAQGVASSNLAAPTNGFNRLHAIDQLQLNGAVDDFVAVACLQIQLLGLAVGPLRGSERMIFQTPTEALLNSFKL